MPEAAFSERALYPPGTFARPVMLRKEAVRHAVDPVEQHPQGYPAFPAEFPDFFELPNGCRWQVVWWWDGGHKFRLTTNVANMQ